MNRIVLGLLILIANCVDGKSFQESTPSDSKSRRRLEMNLQTRGDGIFVASAESEPISVGEQVDFSITLKNPTDHILQFDRVHISCSCLQVKMDDKQISPGSSIEISATFKPTLDTEQQYAAQFSLYHGEKFVCSIGIGGELRNVLMIIPPNILETKGVISNWEIPIIVGKPLLPAELKVDLSPSLGDLTAEIVHKEKTFIRLTAPAASIGLTGISGEIFVSARKQGLKTSARVSILTRPIARVSPMLLTLRRRDSDNEGWTGSVLVQAVDQISQHSTLEDSDSKETASKETKENSLVSVNLKLAKDYKIIVEEHRINARLWRLNIHVPEGQETLPKELKTHWKINTALGIYEAEGLFYLERD